MSTPDLNAVIDTSSIVDYEDCDEALSVINSIEYDPCDNTAITPPPPPPPDTTPFTIEISII